MSLKTKRMGYLKIKLIIILSLFSLLGFSYIKSLENARKYKELKQVKIEKGGILVVENHLKQKEMYNSKDSFIVSFRCDKKSLNSIANCELINYEILKNTPKTTK